MDGYMMIENSQELWAIIKQYPQPKAITYRAYPSSHGYYNRGVRVLGTLQPVSNLKPDSKTFSLDSSAPLSFDKTVCDGRIESGIYPVIRAVK